MHGTARFAIYSYRCASNSTKHISGLNQLAFASAPWLLCSYLWAQGPTAARPRHYCAVAFDAKDDSVRHQVGILPPKRPGSIMRYVSRFEASLTFCLFTRLGATSLQAFWTV